MDLANLFQGIGTLFYQEPKIAIARIALIFLGILLVYLGKRGTLEPLIMIPMGFGMSAVNAGVLFFTATKIMAMQRKCIFMILPLISYHSSVKTGTFMIR